MSRIFVAWRKNWKVTDLRLLPLEAKPRRFWIRLWLKRKRKNLWTKVINVRVEMIMNSMKLMNLMKMKMQLQLTT